MLNLPVPKKIFEKGLIKVVWLERDLDKIYSQMFENESSAVKFARPKKNFVIYKLLWQKNLNEFAWEILPYGNHKLYKIFLRLYKLFF